jgi:hypothetical protein
MMHLLAIERMKIVMTFVITLALGLRPKQRFAKVQAKSSCGVPHIIENLLTRVKTLLQTSPQLEVCTRSYGLPKLHESQFWEFWDSQVRSSEAK